MSDGDTPDKITGISFATWPFKSQFALGLILATHGALQVLETAGIEPLELLLRHARMDWGDLCDEDKKLNDEALVEGGRLLSSYKITETEKIWLITEADRSSSTLLKPDEY